MKRGSTYGSHRGAKLAMLTFASLVMSGAGQFYLVAALGANAQTDAFFAAGAVPSFFTAAISSPLTFVVVPFLAKCQPFERKQRASALVILALLCFGLPSALFVFAAPTLVQLSAPGLTGDAVVATIEMARVLILAAWLGAIGIVVRGAANASDLFVWPAACSVIGAAISLLVIVVGLPALGVAAGAWSMVGRMATELVLLPVRSPVMGRPKITWQECVNIWRMLRPVWLGNAYLRTELLVDRAVTSMAAPGSMAVYSLAQQAIGTVNQVINRGPLAPAMVSLAKAGESGPAQQKQVLVNYARTVTAWCTLVACGLVLVGRPSARLLPSVTSLTHDDAMMFWVVCLMLVGLLFGDSLSHLWSSMFYARGDVRTPTRIGIAVHTAGLALKPVLFLWVGVLGVALSTSAVYLGKFVLLALAKSGRERSCGRS